MIWDEEVGEWGAFDLFLVRDPAEPPELNDDDFCRSMFDPNSGEWLDAP